MTGDTDIPVTHFHDMHSGGGLKTEYGHIYIEAPRKKAVEFFQSWFNRNPSNVTCSCCGPDYSISEYGSLKQATAYHRNCEFKNVPGESGGGHYIEEPKTVAGRERELVTLGEYLDSDDVAFFPRETVEREISQTV